ncbi:DNA-methyltransferase [Acinetobacter beijerinckii]|uniref:DNA-methyltransferase n=1 Tax=Acinetobacter beijerinckii TaxID=262668 RepID=UPI002404A3B0|nr:site-specific DNA-methyltransferase [Acinetobacter beijerinckii]
MTQPFSLYQGDCLQVLKELSDNSIDSIVTDPPYGLKFMGKKWDCEVPSIEIWQECIRVLKPGGHLLAFAGTRTQHRMACNIEDAGFEIRDMIAWIYGSGFPKSHNLDGEWQGWGTALKPALEPITFARKPLIGTVAQNVELYGTGAINIDECRVQTADQIASVKNNNIKGNAYNSENAGIRDTVYVQNQLGRFPANLIHDGSDEVRSYFPEAKGQQGDLKKQGTNRQSPNGIYGGMRPALERKARSETDKSASRFFYCAKANRTDRNEGTESSNNPMLQMNSTMRDCENVDWSKRNGNFHPTVKPTELMRYLCRLVTPKGGVVLDPFMGSGSTGKAAILEGFSFVGIEREAEYFGIAQARCQFVKEGISSKMPDQQDLFMEAL